MTVRKLEDLRKRKLAEVADLRKQALTSNGVGRSLRSLAPVVRSELRQIVHLKLSSGTLREEWNRAQEAASKSDIEDDGDKTLAAVSAILVQFCNEAGKRVMEHGDILIAKKSEAEGRASAIEAMLTEMTSLEETAGDEASA